MASFNRGQSLAQQTKVAHQNLGALKAGSKPFLVSGGDNDAISSKPNIVGRDMVEDVLPSLSCIVNKCGSKNCKMCDHLNEGSNFTSNITNKSYTQMVLCHVVRGMSSI